MIKRIDEMIEVYSKMLNKMEDNKLFMKQDYLVKHIIYYLGELKKLVEVKK